jgi:type 1 fimbriae regulatory protein FimB/type 1 fimbriae regulatory protein FimE
MASYTIAQRLDRIESPPAGGQNVGKIFEFPTNRRAAARKTAPLRLVSNIAPTTEKPTIRKYLTAAELERLLKTVKQGRWGQRDATAILLAFRHGLRVSELCALTWTQIDFTTARLTVVRVKNGAGAPHPLAGDEIRALRVLQRSQEAGSRFVFINQRGAPLSPDGFAKTLTRAGKRCGLPDVHPHMLRHSCGFALAEKGRDLRQIQDYLGHRNVQNTVFYTALAPNRHDRIWE